ncbi:hypothetical protein BpHYR1_028499, partial [Brachionus plicatilis]
GKISMETVYCSLHTFSRLSQKIMFINNIECRYTSISCTNENSQCRTRGDLIQMYKIINGFEKINLVNGINSAKSLALNLRRENNMRLTRFQINKSRIDNDLFGIGQINRRKTVKSFQGLNADKHKKNTNLLIF